MSCMKKLLTIQRSGSALSLDITDFAKEMGLGEGDEVVVVRTSRGFEFACPNRQPESAVAAPREFMLKYPNAMKELAK